MAGSLAAGAFVGLPAQAQDRAQTLADVRQELAVLSVEFKRLKGELNTTSGAQIPAAGASTLDRVNALEAALTRLTGKTEQIEFKIDSVARDGALRLGDLSFRLCDLEPDCDVMNETLSKPLGDVAPGAAVAPVAVQPSPSQDVASQLAVGEKADFDAAVAALEGGNFADASARLTQLLDAYPGSPLTHDAQFMRGEALSAQGLTAEAARAYLAAYSADGSGAKAPDALLKLGIALGQLDRPSEACATLGEVSNLFPTSGAASQAQSERQGLGCN
ncbi:MAG: tol-pal system protein YbgF [Maritimibacter sp.]